MALPLPVASLIQDCNLGPVQVERRGVPIVNEYGGTDPAPETLISFDPIVWHTVNGRDLLQVSESDRTSEMLEVYTTARLFVADGDQAPDVLQIQGRRWRVVKVNNYDAQGDCFFSFAALEDRQL